MVFSRSLATAILNVVIKMKTINEYIKCNDCGARFNADELVMGSSTDDPFAPESGDQTHLFGRAQKNIIKTHGIHEWVCPACGGANYDVAFEDETESW